MIGSWGLWYREQEFPLDSTFHQRAADLWQRYKTRRAERRPWKEAEGLADLGELTAQWAEGTVKYHPGGYDEGPDEETLEIAPALATLNRAGFVTSCSQPGVGPEVGYDGSIFWQRAAVDGFATSYTADRLEAAVHNNTESLIFIRHGRARLQTNRHNAIPVTISAVEGTISSVDGVEVNSDHYVHTCFGTHLSRHAVNFEFDSFGFEALCDAEQITVIDPVWGRKTHLWDTLTAALAPPCCPCRGDHNDE